MGTADKVCAAALAIDEQSRRSGRSLRDVSLLLLELGGAFTAALAGGEGQIVDGFWGSAGPFGFFAFCAPGWEAAFLPRFLYKPTLLRRRAGAVAGGGNRVG